MKSFFLCAIKISIIAIILSSCQIDAENDISNDVIRIQTSIAEVNNFVIDELKKPTATEFPTQQPSIFGKVIVNNSAVRENPDNKSDVVEKLFVGELVKIKNLSQDQEWLFIETAIGSTGWVSIQQIYTNLELEEMALQINELENQALSLAVISEPTIKTIQPEETIMPTANEIQPTSTIRPTKTMPADIFKECYEANLGNVICKISKAYCSYKPNIKGSPTFCNDAPYPSHGFTLLVWGKDWSKFNGKCLIVTGYNHLYKGKPEIEATSESQVTICD